MTRSRQRKLKRIRAKSKEHTLWRTLPVASALLACMHPAQSAETGETATLEEVVVTAQKRSENLQDVPVSIQALSTVKLEQLNVASFNDYVKYLPSVSFQTGGEGEGPGFARIYMRGVSSGGDGNHSASLPSVGVYLDEQPVTTIQGPLDIHVYDIARVEALAGPQGTLYGASSQAGTLRIITNKPDPSRFSAGYDLQGNTVAHGDKGGVVEGFVNLPISSSSAIRLVGWMEHDGGYINNVPGTLTYPLPSGFTLNNSSIAKKHYNGVDTEGGRAALKIDFADSWTVTPTVMGQHAKSGGIFAYDPAKGGLNLSHFYPEGQDDHWVQTALTIEGKISNFDIVYAGALLKRHDETHSDYTDYSLAYNQYASYFQDSAGNALANASQIIIGKDHYKMTSHELRVSSPKEYPFRAIAGLYLQHQQHDIEQRYVIAGLGPQVSVTGWPDTWWLTEEKRINRDYAAFADLSYDLFSQLTAAAGIRYFQSKNSLQGYYGFGLNNTYSSTGEKKCFATPGLDGGPCENLNKEVDETGSTPKLNLTYRIDPQRMVYVTWARGFRPGGVNRVGSLPPYKADFLTSTEFGWKTTWFDNRLRFNGAFFWENWKDFQFSFLAPNSNSVTQIANAGNARIKGVESEIEWAATSSLTLTGGFALMDPKLTQNYCANLDPNGNRVTNCPVPAAPAGQQLPTTPKFKGNTTARYLFNVGSFEAHVQGSLIYQSSVWSDLRTIERGILGKQGAYGVADFSTGVSRNGITAELFIENALDRRADVYNYAECTEQLCGPIRVYHVPNQPRTIGVKFGQKF